MIKFANKSLTKHLNVQTATSVLHQMIVYVCIRKMCAINSLNALLVDDLKRINMFVKADGVLIV